LAEATALERKKVTYFIEHPQPVQIIRPGLRATCQKVKRIRKVGLVCIDITSGELIIVEREKEGQK